MSLSFEMSIHNYLNSCNIYSFEWLCLIEYTQLLLMHITKDLIGQYFLIKILKYIIDC